MEDDGTKIGGGMGSCVFEGICPVCHNNIHFFSSYRPQYPPEKEGCKVILHHEKIEGGEIISVEKVDGFELAKNEKIKLNFSKAPQQERL